MYDPRVRDAIMRYWSLAPKNEEGRVQKQVYANICLRICKVILPGFTEDQARKVIEDDWANDSKGAETLDYFLFYRAMFQLADIWTNSLDEREYEDFLLKIFRRITARKVIRKDGSVDIKHRNIRVVFPDKPKDVSALGWEDAGSQSDNEDFEYRLVEDQTGLKKRVKKHKRDLSKGEEDIQGLEMLYDEVVESDWESDDDMGVLELADLDDIVPIGQAVEAYIAHIKHSPTPSSPDLSLEAEEVIPLDIKGKHQVKALLNIEIKRLIIESLNSNSLNLRKAVSVKGPEGYDMKAEGTPKQARLYDIPVRFVTNTKVLNVWKNKFQMYSFLKKPADASSEPQAQQPANDPDRLVKKEAEPLSIVEIRKALLEQKYMPQKADHEKESPKKPQPPQPPAEDRMPPKRQITKIVPEFLTEEFWLREDPVNSDQDIVAIAAKPQLRMLILGKPRTGKTTLAKELSSSLHVNHIEPANLIDQILAKLKPPEDGYEDEDNPGPKLTPFEQEVINTLQSGQAVTLAQQLQLLRNAVHSDLSKKNGFVLDMTLVSDDHLSLMEQLDTSFTHVVELDVSDNDLLRANHGILQDPDNTKVYTKWERVEVQKPKPKPARNEEDEDEEPPDEEEEVEPPPRLNEEAFVVRAEDEPATLLSQASVYAKQVRPQLAPFLNDLPPNGHISIPSAGLTPSELRAIVEAELGYRTKYLPVCKKLEPVSDFKELLTSELEEGKEPRQWALWKQIDPVALSQGKVIPGKPDLAAEFAGKVFVFDSEENQNKFLANPRPYLSEAPKLPGTHRILLMGGRCAGKHTQAAYLTAKYGWKTVDMGEVLFDVASNQRANVSDPKPSHPDSGLVQFHGPEFDRLMKGDAVPGNTILPLFLAHLQVPMYKKPPPPPEPVEGEEPPIEEEKKEETPRIEEKPQEESSEEEEAIKEKPEDAERSIEKPAEEETPALPTTPEPIVYDDLPLIEIVPKPNLDGSMPLAGGFILIGYPGTEEEVQVMKDMFVGFDKVIYLVDPNGGDELKKREAELDCELDKEIEQVEKAVGLVRDGFGEDVFVEISCVGDEIAIHRKIIAALDPFALLPDDEATIRVKADIQEDDLPLPMGDGGHYDPVILTHEAWLMPGSPDFEAYVMGRKYNFVSEKELETFKSYPADYVRGKLALPPPHVMLLGVRGAGLHTQLDLLHTQFMIDTLDLRDKFVAKLVETRKARRHKRFLARGFVAPEPRDEDDTEPPPNPEETDPQIMEEDEDFDQALHEQKLLRELLPGPQPVFINGNWFDIDAELATSPYVELLHASRKLPEIVIMYTADEEAIVKRNLDTAAIQRKYEDIMAQRKAEREKAKEEERKRKLEEGEEIPDEPEEEEEDVDAPKLPEMIEEEKTKLLARRGEDLNAIEEWKSAFEDKGVKVVLIDTGKEKERVNKNTVYELEAFLQDRLHLIETELVAAVSPKKATDMLARSLVQLSAFKEMSAITPHQLPVVRDYPAIYRQRLYYFKSLEELNEFKKKPREYAETTEMPPWDREFPPRLCIVGVPSSGKTYLATALSKVVDIVPISSRQAIIDLLQQDSILAHEVRELLQQGQPLSEEYKVKAVLARLKKADVREKGYALCGFPGNLKEAQLLAENGVIPNPVLCLTLSTRKVIERAMKRPCFKNHFRVLKKRMELEIHTQEFLAWYQNTWGSVRYLTSERSKWWLQDSAIESINEVFEAKRKFAVALVKKTPAIVKNVGIPRRDIATRLSKFQRFDPVVWRLNGELEHVAHSDYVVMFRDEYYYFASKENMDAFINSPEPFATFKSLPDHLPYKLTPAECGEINNSLIALENHCAVILAKTGKLVKGSSFQLVSYKGKLFTFSTSTEAQEFFKRPWTFEDTKLPKKMPPKPTKVNVLDDYKTYISYMEENVGLTISKALLEIGSVRLLYPRIHSQETALKYLALYLKANNTKTTAYIRDKYRRRMQDFRKDCELEEMLIEDGYKKHEQEAIGGWHAWDDSAYFRRGEEYAKLLSGMDQAGKRYFRKFISY